MNLSNRNRTVSIVIKLVIAVLSVWYIWSHYAKPPQAAIIGQISISLNEHLSFFIAVLLLLPVNWILESWKWKLLASRVVPVTLSQAIKGVLAGVTIGTATPNRVGEFAGRIYSVNSGDKKNLLMLSFISSFCQVLITVLAGALVLIIHHGNAGKEELIFTFIISTLLIICMIPFLTGKFPEKWQSRFESLIQFPRTLFLKILALSFIRYSVYVLQFFLLLKMGYPQAEFIPTIASIAVSYFVVTIVPTFSFTEILVRGTVAGMFIGNDDQLSGIAFYTAALLWTINVAVPSVIGIWFVFRLKFFRKND